jgi:hypothetical protein
VELILGGVCESVCFEKEFALKVNVTMIKIMSKNLCQKNAYIFRIIHKDNLDLVLTTGCLSRGAAQHISNNNYTNVGNLDLIAKRNLRHIPCQPYGTLSDYVPFYFTPYSPMLYNIKTGHGVEKKPMSDILILVSSLHRMKELSIQFVFTDRHAYLQTAQFFNDLSKLDSINWDILQSRDFKRDHEEPEKTDKYQAEALVYNKAPLNSLLGIICYNDEAKGIAEVKAVQYSVSIKVSTIPGWYFQ